MIKKHVESVIKKYKTNNPFELASKLNVNVLFWNLHKEVKGFYKYSRKNKFIVINSNLTKPEQVFTCAHELGHSQEHPRANTPFMREKTLYSVDKLEVEANTYAVELLLPDEKLKEYKNSDVTLHDAAKMNNVPIEVCHLKDLSSFIS
ncbi:ImmA/IrrE family metallo-endopeptidase [Bacillus paralicheniformis]|uniref:ImmA/IrrE family metallo-endopeptidase n=1 Tax=Bacillus paralicheniformis TaxID=1648923 RepID=UPI0019C5AE74|nr:ImmA/IrrE family metallo-endopeptidase [Bacillus paralicheniformis]MBC8621382.1 ImmA/IrrE family metallo-endopeptidase [Robertmurraya crescens]MCM3424058.1 ImmA/IrrE family metallo-endopeptidase [Bacillus paralicheniformis]